MTDEEWTDADDARFAAHMLPEAEPVSLSMAIWEALDEREENVGALRSWVTPESRDDWGDFSELASAMKAQPLGLVSTARQHAGASDVAYVWFIRQEVDTPPRMSAADEAVVGAAIFAWVWRPELGGWRLHSAGASMPAPERLPRTSPDDAPSIEYILI